MTANKPVNSPNDIPRRTLITQRAPDASGAQLTASSATVAPSPIREFLRRRGSGSLADSTFAALMLLCALSIFAIVLFIFTILVLRSKLSMAQFGLKFFSGQNWDPVSGDFGALPFIFARW